MNAYEVRQAWCLLQVKLCYPCLSALKWSLPCKALYKCSALPLPLPYVLRALQQPVVVTVHQSNNDSSSQSINQLITSQCRACIEPGAGDEM